MSGFWYLVIGLLVGAGGYYAYDRFFGSKVIEPPKPEPPKPTPTGLLEAVGTLHKALFSPYGLNVVAIFNAVWKAAGLPEKGVPDINKGKTK